METRLFRVTGMKCEMCQAKVEEALKNLEGVVSAKADCKACSVLVGYDSAIASPQQMKEVVDGLGRFEMSL